VVFVGALTVAMTLELAPPSGLLKGLATQECLRSRPCFQWRPACIQLVRFPCCRSACLATPKPRPQRIYASCPVAIGSAFINNTLVVAMMIPVVRHLLRKGGFAAPSLYMGLSFASKLGGSTTLIGSSVNLIVVGMTADAITASNL
jgi:hypothetical protein